MTVFVLGAGASIHAGYPSGARLGEELAGWAERDDSEGLRYRDDLNNLRIEFGGLTDFEHIVTVLRLDKETGTRPVIPDLGTAISKFFDSIKSGPAELYDRFACKQVQRGDVVVTFNYDLAVERSLKTAGLWEITDGYGAPLMLEP